MNSAASSTAATGLPGGSNGGNVSAAGDFSYGHQKVGYSSKVAGTDPYADRLLVSLLATKTGDLNTMVTQLADALRNVDDDDIESILVADCERLPAPVSEKFFYPRLSADLLLSAARGVPGASGSLDVLLDDVAFLINKAKRLLRAPGSGDGSRVAPILLPSRFAGGGSSNGEWSAAVRATMHCLGYVELLVDGQKQWILDETAELLRNPSTLSQLATDLLLLAAELRKLREQRVKRGLDSPLVAAAAAPSGERPAATATRAFTLVSMDCDTCGNAATVLCHGGDCKGKPFCDACCNRFHMHAKRVHHLSDGSCRPVYMPAQLPQPTEGGSSTSLPVVAASNGSSGADGAGACGTGSLSPGFRSAPNLRPETARGRRVVTHLEVDLQELRDRVRAIEELAARQQEIDRLLEHNEKKLKQLELRQQQGEVLQTGSHLELIACHRKKDLLEEERRACSRLLLLPAAGNSANWLPTSAMPMAPAAQRSLSAGNAMSSVTAAGGSLYKMAAVQQQGHRISASMPPSSPQVCTYADIVDQLRSAERAGIRADLIADALRQMQNERGFGSGGSKVAVADWPLLIESIREAAQRVDPIATSGLTPKEVCSAAATCRLDAERATRHCVDQRQQLLLTVRNLTSADPKTIADCLRQQAADVEEGGGLADVTAHAVALRASAAVLAPFRQRIWQQQLERVDGGGAGAGSGSSLRPLTRRVHDLLSDRGLDRARRARAALAEGGLQSWIRAMNALDIIDRDPPGAFVLSDVLHAVQGCGGLKASLSYLQQECVTCLSTLPRSRLHELTCQSCKVCSECLVQHFSIKIREKPVFDFVCPGCAEPNIAADRGRAEEHFQFLRLILQNHLPTNLLEAFEHKLLDWNLMNDPKFCWCAHCSSGFVYDGDPKRQPRTTCPNCKKSMCFSCRKPWEVQHEGLTCERFAQWKTDNDPRMQAEGVAKNLEENGIDCPKCQFRFMLAKGGCMHFTCTQCKHQFCAGCRQDFSHTCRKLPDCEKRGLHCHHPRNCLYYMRDNSIQQLQQLLQAKGVEYKRALTAQQAEARISAGSSGSLVCRVMEQKEQASGLKDEACGKPATEVQAGLCEVHYKEYLVHLINKACIDPVELMDDKELDTVLRREGHPVPAPKGKPKKEEYVAALRSHVAKVLPLLQLGNVKY